MSFTHKGGGVYQDSRTGNLYERPVINGKRTFRKLRNVSTLKVAKEIVAARRTDQARADAGLIKSPYAPPSATIKQLAEAYQSENCPRRNGHARQGNQLMQEKNRLEKLLPYWGDKIAEKIKQSDCAGYWSHRQSNIARGHGGRAVDLELSTLNSVLMWAVRAGKLDANPLATRPHYRGPVKNHARDFMPKDADELHALAALLFEDKKSVALGWQVLLQAMTGCRSSEIVRLRADAADRQTPGFIEGDWLWLNRSKGGVNPFCLIHPALRECLRVLRLWHDRDYPKSPWFLASCHSQAESAGIKSGSLAHALPRVAKLVCPGHHRTSHGLRAYYVTVRRDQGIQDGQIAAEIGDATGAPIIATTYGEIPPSWKGTGKLSWMPAGKPAWSVLNIPENISGIPVGIPSKQEGEK